MKRGTLAEMRHRNDTLDCPRCKEKLHQAHPKLVAWFNEIKPFFPTVHVAVSYRGATEQNEAFKEGRSRLPFPKSKHNATEGTLPCAKALDLFNLSAEGVATFPWPFYKKIADLCAQQKDPIRWGGTFKTLGDANHFELIDENTA